jgi:excisionase family DNA binding protein
VAFPADIERLIKAKPGYDGEFVALPLQRDTAVIVAELLETFRRMNSPWLNLTQAASYLGVSPSMICHWKNQGKLEAKYGPGMKQARFRREDLDKLMNRAGGGK